MARQKCKWGEEWLERSPAGAVWEYWLAAAQSEPVCAPAAKKANLILGAPNTAHAAHQKSDYPTALSVETASP